MHATCRRLARHAYLALTEVHLISIMNGAVNATRKKLRK